MTRRTRCAKQAKNVSGQLALGAQTMLITIQNLGCTKENLQVTLTQLDRNLAVLKTQRKLGMIGQLQLDTVQNQRRQAGAVHRHTGDHPRKPRFERCADVRSGCEHHRDAGRL